MCVSGHGMEGVIALGGCDHKVFRCVLMDATLVDAQGLLSIWGLLRFAPGAAMISSNIGTYHTALWLEVVALWVYSHGARTQALVRVTRPPLGDRACDFAEHHNPQPQ